jgi:hypothetical protein
MKQLLVISFVVLLMSGCTFVKPSDANLIDDHLGNAQAMNALVQADPSVPPAVKQWIQNDVYSWQWFADIAHRRTPTTQPVR